MSKEEIVKKIELYKQQQEQLIAQLNMCTGAIKALEALLEEPKEEVKNG